MSLSSVSINRPVLSTVFAIVILLFGVVGVTFLGIREFPSVDPPIINVSTSYPGANSDVIETQITEPLEQSINGIQGIRSLTSVSRQGGSDITVEFELSVDMETAANDTRDKVSQAMRMLPRDCDPPVVAKADADASPILQLTIESDKRDLLELSDIAELTFKEQLQTISGVSAVMIFGQKRYAMRLWLDPVKLSGYQLTPLDVRNAISRENVELPSGSIEGNTTQLTIRTLGLMSTPKEFDDLIIKQTGDQIVRFKDIGRAELGPEDIRGILKRDGVPMVSNVIIPQPGSNQIDIVDEVYRRLEYIKKDVPEDITVRVAFDNTQFIRNSIKEVKDTIYIAFALVVIIIYFFLRSWRATLIPILVIPVSLIGSFFIMYVAGYSINVLTLLAIVLAIGIVVDDAIVVMENIYVKVENGLPPIQAGHEGSKEIYFAIISTTITLISVFFPIVFLQGITGRLFREFAIVMAGAVGISAFLALSLTPMVSTKLLRREPTHSWFFRKTEKFFNNLNQWYRKKLETFLLHRRYTFLILIVAFGLIILLWKSIPAEMAPLEDRSQISINTTSQEGATYEFNLDYIDDIANTVTELIPERTGVISMIRGGGGNVRITLVNPSERERTQQEIADQLGTVLRKKTKARSMVMQQSTFGGRRAGMPIQYVLQATSIEKLREILPEFMAEVMDNPTFQMADVNLKFTKPELRIHIDRSKASSLGVSTQNIGQTLQLALSGQRYGYFFMNGKQYQILGDLARNDRNKPLDLKSLYVRNIAIRELNQEQGYKHRIAELDRPLRDLQKRDVGRGAHLQGQLGGPVDHLGRIDGGHRHHLLQREAHVEELAHHPGQIGHAGGVAREHMDIGGDGIGAGASRHRHLGDREIEAAAAMAHVEHDAALLGGQRRRQELAVLYDVRELARDVGSARIAVREHVAGPQRVEDLAHQLGRLDAADVAHHLGSGARHLAGLDGALQRLRPVLGDDVSLMRTPSTRSAFSATALAAASVCAKSML